eukprot:scaffold12177_cov74-Phaeocystis_antarctica.AAC.2
MAIYLLWPRLGPDYVTLEPKPRKARAARGGTPVSEDAVDAAAPLQASIAKARAPCSQTDDAAPSL